MHAAPQLCNCASIYVIRLLPDAPPRVLTAACLLQAEAVRMQQNFVDMEGELTTQLDACQRELAESRASAESQAAAQKAQADSDVSDLQTQLEQARAVSEQLRQQMVADLEAASTEHTQQAAALTWQVEEMRAKLQQAEQSAEAARNAQAQAESSIGAHVEGRTAAEAEVATIKQQLDAATQKVCRMLAACSKQHHDPRFCCKAWHSADNGHA